MSYGEIKKKVHHEDVIGGPASALKIKDSDFKEVEPQTGRGSPAQTGARALVRLDLDEAQGENRKISKQSRKIPVSPK